MVGVLSSCCMQLNISFSDVVTGTSVHPGGSTDGCSWIGGKMDDTSMDGLDGGIWIVSDSGKMVGIIDGGETGGTCTCC